MEWQPIETAPKDGRWLLGAWSKADDDFGYVTSTVRYKGKHDWEEKQGQDSFGYVCEPTHYAPLPPLTKGTG